MTNVAIQYPRDVFSVWKRKIIDLNFGIFKPLMTFAAFRMGDLCRRRQRKSAFRMTGRTRGFLPAMTFKAGFLGRAESRWVMRVMIDIVVAGGAGIL